MSLFVPDTHTSLSLAPDLKAIRESYFPNSPISYFQYLKVNKDGSIAFLTDRADWIKTIWTIVQKEKLPAVYSCAKMELLDKDSFWFLWDHNLPKYPVSLAREFGIANGLTFVERSQNYYHMTAFGTHTHYEGALDYYYTNFDRFRSFINYIKNSNLIKVVDKNIIHLTPEYQDENRDLLVLPRKHKKYKTLQTHNQSLTKCSADFIPESYFTHQEFECIKRLPLGKTAKEIAKDLNISPRTVESYFRRVMLRTGAKNKQELIKLLSFTT